MTSSPTQPLYLGKVTDTPLGDLWIACSDLGLVAVEWAASRPELMDYLMRRLKRAVEHNPKQTAHAASELREYLDGKLHEFSIPIDWSQMRPFQRQVLQATFAIPYGQITTYGLLAEQIGRPKAARAVGRAQATNPMPLVIPCHRVLAADGKLTGYGGGEGLKTKKWLLLMEGVVLA